MAEKKVRLMADLAADIPKEVALRYNIAVLPFYINCGEESILADINYTPKMFYEKFKSLKDIPSTSQATPELLEEMYRDLGKDSSIIHVTISSNGSGIVNTARMVSEGLNDEGFDITIVDSQNYSYGIGANVVDAAKLLEDGAGKDEIIAFLTERYEKDDVYFIVDDLKYLQKGGRIKATTMVISDVLDIKPILKSNDGLVEAFMKVRGSKKAVSKMVDIVAEKIEDAENATVYVLHADVIEKAENVAALIKEKVNPKAIEIVEVGPIITCHAGVGVYGVYFRHK